MMIMIFFFLLFFSFDEIIDGNESDSHHYLINERNYREFLRLKGSYGCELMGN
jgi:hypothetical protein